MTPIFLIAYALLSVAASEMDTRAQPSFHDKAVFSPDPSYKQGVYNGEEQVEIYGGKRAVPNPRPLLEIGRPQYRAGPFRKGLTWFGKKNPMMPNLSFYGDVRLGIAQNDQGAKDTALLAARINLDIDYKLTSTERLHLFYAPIDKNGKFTRFEFAGDTTNGKKLDFVPELDPIPRAAFFEGDIGAMVSGGRNKYTSFDLPIALGIMPLLFQNGIFMEDAITGLAVSYVGQNSRKLGISNYDLTFFTAFDNVNNLAIRDAKNNVEKHKVFTYGMASFFDVLNGYLELDYAFIHDIRNLKQGDFSHHNLAGAYTHRIFDRVSSAWRVMSNVGQKRPASGPRQANGVLFLWENAWITPFPSVLVPYSNFFLGVGRTQSVARDNGDVLKNTGINFETDGLTGFPRLNDSGADALGGALGVSYLFKYNRQIVAELATTHPYRGTTALTQAGKLLGTQVAGGLRFQQPFAQRCIVRFDVVGAFRKNDDPFYGVRLELRVKL